MSTVKPGSFACRLEQLIHRGVPDTFADPEGAAVHAIRHGRRGERVDRAETAVVVSVVVECDVAFLDDVAAEEREKVPHALGRRVTDGIRGADPPSAAAHRGLVEL